MTPQTSATATIGAEPRDLPRAVRPTWRLLRRLAAGTLCVGAGVAALELGLRVWLDGGHLSPPVFRTTADSLGYALLPSSGGSVEQFGRRLSVLVDADGHRRTPDQPGSAPAVLHLVGDSQVFGWGLSDGETIAASLQRRLGAKARVVNHGVPGYGPAQYVEIVRRLPSDALVLVLHTEENDGADAYALVRQNSAACTFIASFAEQDGPLRCALMRSRVVQYAFVSWNLLQHRYHMTPPGFSARSLVAGAVLQRRIADGWAAERARRKERMAFSVVPWKGRYSADWQTRYAPPPLAEAAALPAPFFDEVGMAHRFAADPDAARLYLAEDTHLSPAGADRLAEELRPAVERLLAGPNH